MHRNRMSNHNTEDETVGRYVAGTITGGELAAFEQHLIACEPCRNEVRLATVLRAELATHRPAAHRQRAWLAGLGVACAAAGVVVAIAIQSPSPIRHFGAVTTAPPYQGVAVRNETASGDVAFGIAMTSYQKGSFVDATRALRHARSAGADSVTSTFFLAASLLLTGHAREAAEEFRRVARMGPTPYEGESHFYRGKALLQLGEPDAAALELRLAARIDGHARQAAAALYDSVEAARTR